MRYCLIFIFVFVQAQEHSNIMIDSFQTFESYASINYNQAFRPKFHFSSKKNWINDPNGLVYYKGEYHLFFQHNPKSINWGNMTWGHAISRDMIKWVQLPHAIFPYGNGTIFSGTAVVDNINSLGKNTEKEKAIVAYFTHAQKNKDPFYQSGAYSIDRGRSFNLIDQGKPLVPNQGFSDKKREKNGERS
jgi:sucrose-6-phosphate hydrolase SacC (GH32 family)